MSEEKIVISVTVVFSLSILLCWSFPHFWYTKVDTVQKRVWFAEQTNIVGWQYHEVPVAESAESALVADRLVNGEFSKSDGKPIRVFSANRFREKENEIGLFVHTPDRCWTETGWELEAVFPDLVQVKVHGIPLHFERRVFSFRNQRELVYFCGMVGGQPLPYRLDHNLGVGMKLHLRKIADKTGSALRASDSRLWQRVWDAFISRRRLFGPKQFLRISTPLLNDNLSEADRRLQDILPFWLSLAEYQSEIALQGNSAFIPASVAEVQSSF